MIRPGLACVLLVVACVPGSAQEPSEPPAASIPDVDIPTAAVEIDGARLFEVRGVSAFPAESRAAAIAARIRAVARDRAVPADGLRIEESDLGTVIVGGAVRVIVVTEGDALLERMPRPTLAQTIRARIAQAIEAYRTARTPEALAGDAWRAGAATLPSRCSCGSCTGSGNGSTPSCRGGSSATRARSARDRSSSCAPSGCGAWYTMR